MEIKSIEDFQAALKETVGEVRAELAQEAERLSASLKNQFGSIDAAKAAGQETDIFVRSGHEDAQPARGRKIAKASVGRFLRTLAANEGSAARAEQAARDSGETELANLFKASQDQRKIKAQLLSDFGSGGALVPEEFSDDVIDLLYPADSIMGMGIQMVPMPNGQLTIPFLDTGVSASYVGEAVNISPSEQGYGQLQLNAKKLAAVTPVSNDLLRTPSAMADRFIENDMREQFRVRMEKAFLADDGTSGKPKGLKEWAIAANTAAQGGTALANKVSDLGTMIRLVQDQNVPINSGGYLMSHRTEWGLKLTLDSLGNFVFLNQMEAGSLMGYRYKATTNVVDNLGGGSESYILFASFGHVVVGDTGSLEISVHPSGSYHDGTSVVSGVSTDTTPIRGIARHDIGCRYRGKEVSLLTGVTWA